ncbi:MAG: aminomethyl-transferring glycine dehydrogenase subunit GcvPB [Acidobacteriia bacterium]|nr:aminomethyl-transferring glycine dehydrogenase subunit GcvPB [Terriglobia bacterium]
MASEKITKASTHVSQDEGLLFERSAAGKWGVALPDCDVPRVSPEQLLDRKLLRETIEDFPEVTEVDVVRHFTRLSTWNYAIDLGLYPLGSCTMKYNPKINENVARIPGLAHSHPYLPYSLVQGNLKIQHLLMECLKEITGMDAVSLQPAAGAQGELTGILMIRAFLESKGNPRTYILIPDSAHGTNPSSAAIAGYQVKNLKSGERGCIDPAVLRTAMTDDVAALMLTNPNTLGVYESDLVEIIEIVHSRGGLVYMDGANMNALVGITKPGNMGVDVMHLNLHKTFSTPHGGGGPGSGPVAVKTPLEPFLPTPVLEKNEEGLLLYNFNRPQSVGRVRSFYGNFGMHVRALAYTLANGPDGLRQTTEDAVLNANYIRSKLQGVYDLPYSSPSLHEVVFSDKLQSKFGVSTMDIAKRLIDYGFHPPTVYFPLIVHGALMIEPTESESLDELDEFVHAMQSIAEECEQNPELVKGAPHHTRVRRLDEVGAARHPILRWKPDSK